MKWLSRLMQKLSLNKNKKKQVLKLDDLDIDAREDYINNLEFQKSLEKNLKMIREIMGNSYDLSIRKFKIGKAKRESALIYISGLTDNSSQQVILESLEADLLQVEGLSSLKDKLFENVAHRFINNKSIREVEEVADVLKDLTNGSSAIFLNGISRVLLCETAQKPVRNVEEPASEISLMGPHDGFVEDIYTNTALVRYRVRTPNLWFQNIEKGSLSKSNIVISYIKGLASEELVEEVKARLNKIDLDVILDVGYIQEYIKDEPFTLFPLIDRTERPDKVVSCLAEGKVAIFLTGSPSALIVPATYNMFLMAPDDYYETFPVGSFIRLLRHGAFLLSILLPGTYVALINFHPEILPMSLFLRIAATREGVPFPVVLESLLMESLFEILREAGLRLPRAIGSAISIVGALVLGEAAISAGLVSPPMVIIVAITAISSFTTPNYALATTARILRYIFIVLGGTLGMFGIQFGVLLFIIHMCSLRSFGQPYFQPYAPFIWQDLKDSIIRVYWWKLITRPKLTGGRQPQRQKKGQQPKTPREEEQE